MFLPFNIVIALLALLALLAQLAWLAFIAFAIRISNRNIRIGKQQKTLVLSRLLSECIIGISEQGRQQWFYYVCHQNMPSEYQNKKKQNIGVSASAIRIRYRNIRINKKTLWFYFVCHQDKPSEYQNDNKARVLWRLAS